MEFWSNYSCLVIKLIQRSYPIAVKMFWNIYCHHCWFTSFFLYTSASWIGEGIFSDLLLFSCQTLEIRRGDMFFFRTALIHIKGLTSAHRKADIILGRFRLICRILGRNATDWWKAGFLHGHCSPISNDLLICFYILRWCMVVWDRDVHTYICIWCILLSQLLRKLNRLNSYVHARQLYFEAWSGYYLLTIAKPTCNQTNQNRMCFATNIEPIKLK